MGTEGKDRVEMVNNLQLFLTNKNLSNTGQLHHRPHSQRGFVSPSLTKKTKMEFGNTIGPALMLGFKAPECRGKTRDREDKAAAENGGKGSL